MTDFIQDFIPRAPMVDVAGALSPFLNQLPGGRGVASGLGARRDPILTNAPRAQKALENKYSGYFPELAKQYDQRIVNAMIAMDSDRVTRGQSPLSQEETRRALETAQTGVSVTGEAKPSPFNFFGNAVRNIGDIVRAIPRLPMALVDEVKNLSTIGDHVAKANNPISGLASAPGIRMLPGAYLLENIAEGDFAELATNPVFTALDILPLGHQLAKGTKVATAAREAAEAVARGELSVSVKEARALGKMERRPMAAAINNTIDAEGNIVRTAVGQTIDAISDSRMARPLRQWFSQTERDVMFTVNAAQQRVHNIVRGIQSPGDLSTPAGQLDDIAREAVKLREDLVKLDPAIEARIPDITEKMVQGKWNELTGVDAQAAEMYRATMQRATEWSVANNYHVLYRDEVYDLATGIGLRKSEARLQAVTRFNATRQRMLAGTVDAPTALTELRDLSSRGRKAPAVGKRTAAEKLDDLNAQRITEADVTNARRLTMRGLESSGYDISHFKFKKRTKNGVEVEALKRGSDFDAAVNDVISGRVVLPKKTLMNLDQVMEVIRANKKAYEGNSIALLEAGIAKGEWKVVSKALETLRKQKGNPALSDPLFIDSIRQMRETSKELARTAKFSDEALMRMEERLARREAKTPSARFLPEIDRQSRKTVTEQLVDEQFYLPTADALSAAKVIEMADRGMWTEIPGWTEQMHRRIQNETKATWLQMKADGFDPMFVHTVPSNRLSRVLHPGESIVPNTPSSTKARKMDLAPGFKDFTIAASDQMIEFLRQRETEVAIKHINDMVGESEASLRAQMADAAEARYAKAPVRSVEQHLTDMINEKWTKFNPDEMGYNWGSPFLNQLKQSDVMIPKITARNLHALADPKQIAGGLFDPFTKTFRIAVVGLSIRTQLYNIIGGAVSLELRSPGTLLRQMDKVREFRQAVSSGDYSKIPVELQEVVGSQKATLLQLDEVSQGVVVGGVANYLKGKKMREWWDAHQAKKVPGQPHLASKFGDKFRGITEKLYDFNALFDDMYRVTAYWDEFDKATKKGATRDVAAAKAIGESRRVLQDWMGMTPMERATMKSLVPFYGFMSHAMRYVMQFPLDHPLRAEFMSKMAHAELEDMEGLPKRFLSSLFFGAVGEDGGQNSLNLAPLNPFGDVANLMTISGFLGSANPVLTTMFQMVGLDQGKADLYPSLRYDAISGRLSAKNANPLMALLDNTIPQSGFVTAMLGMNSQFNEQLIRDPAAASRFLQSSMTLPILFREYNIPQEQFKAEMARMDAESKVKNEALRTGDWREALRYPNLAQYLAALDALPVDMSSPFARKGKEDIRKIAMDSMEGRPPGLPSVTPLDDTIFDILSRGPSLVGAGAFGVAATSASGLGVRGAQPPAVSIAGGISSAGNI